MSASTADRACRHAGGGRLEGGAGALGADDRALELPVGTLRERLPVEGGRGGRPVVHGDPEQGIARVGGRPVHARGGLPDDLLIGGDLGERGLLGLLGLLQFGGPRSRLLLEAAVLAGGLEQRALRGQGEGGGIERAAAGRAVGCAGEGQGGDGREQHGAQGDDAQAGRPAGAGARRRRRSGGLGRAVVRGLARAVGLRAGCASRPDGRESRCRGYGPGPCG